MQSFHDIDNSPLCSSHPVGEVHIVRYSSTEHDQANMLRKHNNGLLPYNSSLSIVYVMNLIEDDPLDISYHFSTSVQVITQNLGCHNDTASLRIHTYVSCHYSHWVKLFRQLPIFLIGKSLYRGGIYDFSFVFQS